MSLSTTSAATVALFTLAVVAAAPSDRAPAARAEIVRLAPGAYRSVTTFAAPGGQVRIEEAVTLDAADHLLTAYVRVAEDGRAPTTTWLDRAAERVVTAEGAAVTRAGAPADAPWAYVAMTADHRLLPTALGAWVLARAAGRGAPVRVVGAAGDALVPADQLLATGEEGATAIVGDDAVDLDADFVRSVRVRALGASLARTSAEPNRWLFAVAAPADAVF